MSIPVGHSVNWYEYKYKYSSITIIYSSKMKQQISLYPLKDQHTLLLFFIKFIPGEDLPAVQVSLLGGHVENVTTDRQVSRNHVASLFKGEAPSIAPEVKP